jgi:hypothetical protein
MKVLALVVLSCFISTPDSCDMNAKANAPSASAVKSIARRICSADHRFGRREVYPITMRADIAKFKKY